MTIRFNCLNNEHGSASIEATLVLPVVFLISVLLMFCAVYLFQSEWTYLTASVTADRIAHTWDNSHKHPVTGMFVPMQRDPLYWRLLYDGAEHLFHPLDGARSESIAFPSTNAEEGSLIIKKLIAGTAGLPNTLAGRAAYFNRGWNKSVLIETAHPFRAPNIFGVRWGNRTSGASEETIVEPAEFIRNIDLVRSYLMTIEQKWDPGTIQKMLAPWLNNSSYTPADGKPLEFALHAEAVRYLRSLVRGSEARFNTEQTGEWRLVDALDGQGIAHQAYLGTKSLNADMRSQLMKDVELIRKGEVKGVVWHFFRRTGSGAGGPNAALRKELEKYGIAVIVHT
jgi:hypothetical protein